MRVGMGHDTELLSPHAAAHGDAPPTPTPPARGRFGMLLGSIQARLQLSHLLASLLPLLALGSLLVYTSARSERRTAEQVQVSVARSIASDMSSLLAGLAVDLRAFGERAAQPNKKQTLPAAADALLERHASLVELSVLDADGMELLRRAQSDAVEDLPLRSRSAELSVRAALNGEQHRGIVSSPDGLPLIRIGVPIMVVRETVGAVAADISTQLLTQRLASVPPSIGRNAFLVDETGTLLVGQLPRSLVDADQLQSAWEADATLATLPTNDGNIMLARAPLGEGWYVVVEQPATGANAGSTALLTILLLCTACLVAVWAVVLAREMSGPLLRLHEAARNAGAGVSVAELPVERADEVGDLAIEFNRMLERLGESRAENEQHSRELGVVRRELQQRSDELRDSLALASIVQHDLLTHAPPPDAPVEAAAASEPAAEVGGDFYSFIGLPDGRLRLAIGDASGTGVAAALVLALTSSLLEIHAREAADPADLLERLNAILHSRFAHSEISVGLLVAEFDQRSGRLSIANAGMIAPLVAGRDGQEYVECFGPALGVVERPLYEAVSVPLIAGQTAVFVSDGIVEARNDAHEMWSFARLERAVSAALGAGPEAVVEQVLQAVHTYTASDAPAGDRTIVAVRLKEAASWTTQASEAGETDARPKEEHIP